MSNYERAIKGMQVVAGVCWLASLAIFVFFLVRLVAHNI